MRELLDDVAFERYNHALGAAKSEMAMLASPYAKESAAVPMNQERIAVGQNRARKFLLVK